MSLVLPPLYMILDAALLTISELEAARKLADAGVRLIQYRNKRGSSRELLQASSALAAELVPRGALFFVNDRPDVALLSGANGVHIGQSDLPVAETRAVLGQGKLLGVSTHNLEQFRAAAETDADYIALGPVFATDSKANPDPVVGTVMIREARKLTKKTDRWDWWNFAGACQGSDGSRRGFCCRHQRCTACIRPGEACAAIFGFA